MSATKNGGSVNMYGTNAKKKLLGGMSLNGQTMPVGGITPPFAFCNNAARSIKGPRACLRSCFPLVVLLSALLFFISSANVSAAFQPASIQIDHDTSANISQFPKIASNSNGFVYIV
jgi:hypothetical protein